MPRMTKRIDARLTPDLSTFLERRRQAMALPSASAAIRAIVEDAMRQTTMPAGHRQRQDCQYQVQEIRRLAGALVRATMTGAVPPDLVDRVEVMTADLKADPVTSPTACAVCRPGK